MVSETPIIPYILLYGRKIGSEEQIITAFEFETIGFNTTSQIVL